MIETTAQQTEALVSDNAEVATEAVQVDPAVAALHTRVYTALGGWADKLADVRPTSTKHLAADMADIYVSAEQYRGLVDRLVALSADQREDTADQLIEIGMELDHIAWHIRSCRARVTRLARDLYPEDDDE